jgi:hypothetical protein
MKNYNKRDLKKHPHQVLGRKYQRVPPIAALVFITGKEMLTSG